MSDPEDANEHAGRSRRDPEIVRVLDLVADDTEKVCAGEWQAAGRRHISWTR